MAMIRRAASSIGAMVASLVMMNTGLAGALTVTPIRGLVDEPFVVRVDGTPPGARVRVQAELTDDNGQTWTSVGEYLADSSGVVDTASAASVAGTYEGVLPGGLSCSVLPVPQSELAQYIKSLRDKPARTTPDIGTKDSFTVRVSAQVDGETLGPVNVTRAYRAPEVSVTDVDAGHVQGLYFEPPAGARGVPVVVLGGSGGGLQHASAMLLASHGHPTLALAYFAYKDLPAGLVDIPLEAFGAAAAWLKNRTGAPGVVLMGTSRGSEAVMLTAAYLPDNIVGLISIVPSPLVHAAFGKGIAPGQTLFAWTLGGRGIPPVRPKMSTGSEAAGQQQGQNRVTASKGPPGYIGTPYFLANWNDPVAHLLFGIPVERIRVPMLLLGGEADTMWPSALGVTQIRERMIAHGKGDLVEAHTYPDAGHSISRIGVGNEMSSFSVHAVGGYWVSTGGLPDANCRAGYDVWSRVFEFLQARPASNAQP